MRRYFYVLFGAFWFVTKALQGETTIVLYSPYDYEPFVISEMHKSGLMFDLETALNGKGPYRFEVRVVPRSRVLRLLDKGEACVVPWVSPAWFDDPNRQRFQWTAPLTEDENVLVSPIDRPIRSLDVKEVHGKSTVTVLGHRDPRIDALIERGEIRTTQQSSRRSSFQMVARSRVDFLLSGRMIVDYFIKDLALGNQVLVSSIPDSRFERRILICRKQDESLRIWLDQQLTRLVQDKAWQERLHSK